jgi:hypothetical protein
VALLKTNKYSVDIHVKRIPEASIVLAVHFWMKVFKLKDTIEI